MTANEQTFTQKMVAFYKKHFAEGENEELPDWLKRWIKMDEEKK